MPLANTLFGSSSQSAPMSSYTQTPSVSSEGHSELGVSASAIDGTPMRVATIIVLMVAGLAGLKWAGWRFNVTTSVG
jgi:hypothetical protein